MDWEVLFYEAKLSNYMYREHLYAWRLGIYAFRLCEGGREEQASKQKSKHVKQVTNKQATDKQNKQTQRERQSTNSPPVCL